MEKVLVVGGAGYIGGHTTDRLLEEGYEVRIYDSLVFEERYLKKVDFVYGDIRDRELLKNHLLWADVVVWLAAIVGDPACALNPGFTKEINVESLNHLVKDFKGRIINISSCSVYGAQDGILNEDSPLNPLSLYAETKVEGEKILSESNSVTFRLGTIFGLGDTYSRIRLDLVVNVLTLKACLFSKISVYGGSQYRPLLHVKDVAEAILSNISSPNTGIYNLHTENMTILQVAERVMNIVPNVEMQTTDVKFQDARNYRVSSDKAKKAFGFSPKYTIDYGIHEIKSLVEEGRIKDVLSPRYSNADYLRPLLLDYNTPLGLEISSY